MMSSRYAIHTIILFILTAIPTILHVYVGARHDDGLSTRDITTSFNRYISSPSKRGPAWGEVTFGTEDWVERDYVSEKENGRRIRLFAARAYDPKRIYHHPELAVFYGRDLRNKGVVQVKSDTEIPVHVLKSPKGRELALYTLIYDGQYVSNPILFQLSSMFGSLVSAKKPMTIIMVYSNFYDNKTNIAKTDMFLLLQKASQEFIY